jgi:hypothetical protein
LGIYILTLSLGACQYPRAICQDCETSLNLWQETIDAIALSNFPDELGYYKAVIWKDRIDNAWVTRGREVNVTESFLNKLNPTFRLSVAAHELAHLKLNHYYSRIGIIIVESDNRDVGEFSDGSNMTPKGFGEDQEIEADRLALQYIQKIGINPTHYLQMLKWFAAGNENPDIQKDQFFQGFIIGWYLSQIKIGCVVRIWMSSLFIITQYQGEMLKLLTF